jgi:hypothetical protein
LDWLRASAAATGFLAAATAAATGLLAAATTGVLAAATAAARTLATATTLTATTATATRTLATATTLTATAAAATGPLAATAATTALTGFLLTLVTDIGVDAHDSPLLSVRSKGKKQADPLSSANSTDCEMWMQRGLRLTSKNAYSITSCRR